MDDKDGAWLKFFARAAAFISFLGVMLTVFSLNHVNPFPDLGIDVVALVAEMGVVFGGVALAWLFVVMVRYTAAALGRIRLEKNDIYFIVALVLSVVTFLIGQYWR
ncbi:MAG TPA: hypothetical protein VH349_10820 [Ktedonobacterales bacterium]|jgi:hypothetical protein